MTTNNAEALRQAAESFGPFLDAYNKAFQSSQPHDWMEAALYAKHWHCRVVAALASQPQAAAWRDGFPPLTNLDDKPCKGPDGRPIPPMRESDEVIVCTDDGRVVMDHCCAIGDGMPLWFLNARRVLGWMPKPAALNRETPDA